MKKCIITAFIASLSTVTLLGCSSLNAAGSFSSADSESSVMNTDSSSDTSDESGRSSSIDESTADDSITIIDDESTALISSSEDFLAAIDLFEELMATPDIDELDESQIATLKAGISECDGSKFIGSWHRTFVVMGEEGDISISLSDDNTCIISGGFLSYGNTGSIEDITGYFLTENLMFAIDDYFDTVYLFKISGDSMDVKQKGTGWMGAGVSAIGTYVTGDAEYLNAHDIEFAFTTDELDAINTFLDENGLDHEEYFEDAIFYGIFETSANDAIFEDGRIVSGRWFTSVAPHGLTRNLNLFLADDGNIYLESSYNSDDESEFYTTDETASTMPVQSKE